MTSALFIKKSKLCLTIFLLFTSFIVKAQTSVSGKVTGSDNSQPIAGASVKIKDTNEGTTTGSNGVFSINAKKNDVLVISYIGYLTQEITVNNRASYDVVLAPGDNSLGEVVVTGYTSQRKKDITGSVAVVDMRSLKTIPAGSAVEALQGQASGVNIISPGTPGGPSNVFIRGVSSFGNTQPLVMVDGIQGDLSNINAEDIESMQVLKDAGAAAIYGVRGSNGVIIVTTKKGKSGQPVVTYDAYYGVQLPLPGNPFDLLGSADYARLSKVANPGTNLFANGLPDYLFRGPGVAGTGMEGDPEVDPANYNFDPVDPTKNYLIQKVDKTGVNWFQQAFDPAPMMNHTLTASGGTDKSNYLFSMGYFNQQGTLKETYLKRYNARLNTQFKIRKNIRIGENVNFFYRQNPTFTNLTEGNPVSSTYRIMPIIPVYDIGGHYGGTFTGAELGEGQNAVAMQERTRNNRNNNWNVIGNVFAEVDFLRYFTARTSFGGTVSNTYNINFGFTTYNNTTANSAPNTLSETALYTTNTMWTNTLSFRNTYGKHALSVIAGSEAIRNYGRTLLGSSQGLFSTNFDFLSLTNGTLNINTTSTAFVNTIYSLFSRLDYSYNDKYLLGVTVRRDGSSKFGANSRYGVFPSVSLGWRVTNEPFLNHVPWLNDLKLRGSYGVLGAEQNVDNANAFTLFAGGFGTANYDIAGTSNSAQQGFFQTRNGNPNTGWEENVISNVGFDATLFQKLSLSVEYYKKSVNGLLFPQPLAATAGNASSPVINIGDIQNTGLDISASYRGNITGDLQFSVATNITTYKNMVKEIPDPGFFEVSSSRIGNLIRNQEGHPVSSFFGYEVERLFRDEADVANAPVQNAAAPGRFKYRDVNGDKQITPEDRTFFGSPNPDFTYGLNLGLTFKNIDFSAMFYGSQGAEVLNHTRWWTDFFGTFAGAKRNVLLNAWTPDNPDSQIPKVEQASNFSTSAVNNSYYMENGSYLRLKSLVAGYTISPGYLKKFGLTRLRFYLQAANLFTITKYSGLDPEVGGNNTNTGNSSSVFGIDYGNYPNNQQNFLFGLNLSF